MSVESSSSNKKHRVIAWKPEGAETAEKPRRGFPRWARNALWVLGVFLFWRLGIAPFVFHGPSSSIPGAPASAESISTTFANRSQAEFARAEAMRAVEVIAKTSPDHPTIVNYLVTIDKLRNEADKSLADGNFVNAVQRYNSLTGRGEGAGDFPRGPAQGPGRL